MSSNNNDSELYADTYNSIGGLHPETAKAYQDAKFEPQITPKQAIQMKFDEMYGQNPALAAKIRKRINAIWRFHTPTVDDYVIFEVTDIGSDFVGNESFRTYKVGRHEVPSFYFAKDQMSGQPTSVRVARRETKYDVKYSPETIEEILNSGDSSMAKLYIHDGRFTYMIYDLDSFINLPGDQLIETIYEQRANAAARGDERVAGKEGQLIKGNVLDSGAAMAEPHSRRSSGSASAAGAARRAGVRPVSSVRATEALRQQAEFERNYTRGNLDSASIQGTPEELATSANRVNATVQHDVTSYENARAELAARMAAARAKAEERRLQEEAELAQQELETVEAEEQVQDVEQEAEPKVLDAQNPKRAGPKSKGQNGGTKNNKKGAQGTGKKNMSNNNNNNQEENLSKSPNAKMGVKETVYVDVKPDPKATAKQQKPAEAMDESDIANNTNDKEQQQ